MKQKWIFISIIAGFVLACGSRRPGAIKLTIPTIPADYTKLDLTKTGLAADLMAPAGATVEKSTLYDNESKRHYFIIRAFAIPNDAADPSRRAQAAFNIYTTKRAFAQHRDDVKFRPTIGFKSWLIDEPDFIAFSTRPGNSIGQPIREKDAEVYHFLISRKGKDGQQYIIATSSSMDFTKEEMLKLLAIAKSVNL